MEDHSWTLGLSDFSREARKPPRPVPGPSRGDCGPGAGTGAPLVPSQAPLSRQVRPWFQVASVRVLGPAAAPSSLSPTLSCPLGAPAASGSVSRRFCFCPHCPPAPTPGPGPFCPCPAWEGPLPAVCQPQASTVKPAENQVHPQPPRHAVPAHSQAQCPACCGPCPCCASPCSGSRPEPMCPLRERPKRVCEAGAGSHAGRTAQPGAEGGLGGQVWWAATPAPQAGGASEGTALLG